MFGSHKVKIEGELLDKVKQCAEACGYRPSTNSWCMLWKKK